jgi:lipopolysaccharide assembly outer membrane protein LptD (OstA)
LKNVVFYIKKIPVLYLPWVRYPLQKDGRATGFLFPGIGFDQVYGFFLKNAFYLDLKENIDMTFWLDYYKQQGIGTAEEVRYLFPFMSGSAKFYKFYYYADSKLKPATRSTDYILKMAHSQFLKPFSTKINVSIDHQSDAGFLRMFDRGFESRLRREYTSALNINSYFGDIQLNIGATQVETFYTSENASKIRKNIPSVALDFYQKKIWKIPGTFSFSLNYIDTERKGKSLEINEIDSFLAEDIKTNRIRVAPSYRLELLNTKWLAVAAELDTNQARYAKSKDPKTQKTLDEPLQVGYYSGKLLFQGPSVAKIFRLPSAKMKHIIEPVLRLNYSSKLDDDLRLRIISADYSDFPSYSYVKFGFQTSLLYKSTKTDETSSHLEILNYSITQDYYFDPELANFRGKINDMYPVFSELGQSLRVKLSQDFSLNSRVSYNYYAKKTSNFNLDCSYEKPSSFLKGNIYYQSYINVYAPPDNKFNRSYLGGTIDISIPGFPLKSYAKIDYDMTEDIIRNGTLIAAIDFQCITISGKLLFYTLNNKTIKGFTIGVNFGNLGKVKDFINPQVGNQ